MITSMITKRRKSIKPVKGIYVALRMETVLVTYCTLLVSDQSSSLLGVGQWCWWNPRVMTLVV